MMSMSRHPPKLAGEGGRVGLGGGRGHSQWKGNLTQRKQADALPPAQLIALLASGQDAPAHGLLPGLGCHLPVTHGLPASAPWICSSDSVYYSSPVLSPQPGFHISWSPGLCQVFQAVPFHQVPVPLDPKVCPCPTPVLFQSLVLPGFYSSPYLPLLFPPPPALKSVSLLHLPCPLTAEVLGLGDGQHNHCPNDVRGATVSLALASVAQSVGASPVH